VVRNPDWDEAWGDGEIHPVAGAIGEVVAWSDMVGDRHGEAPTRSSN
jgi:hypothetical protein